MNIFISAVAPGLLLPRKREYFSPPMDLSNRLGIQLYDDWGLKNHADLQEKMLASPERFDGNTEEILEIAALLPDYGWRGRARFDYVLGAVSQIRLEDIIYFQMYTHAQRPPEITARQEAIRERFDGETQWIMSPVTLHRIEEALR